MTGAELRSRLEAIPLAQRQFAIRIGVHPVTVFKWLTEVHPIPRWVERDLADIEANPPPSTEETTDENADSSP